MGVEVAAGILCTSSLSSTERISRVSDKISVDDWSQFVLYKQCQTIDLRSIDQRISIIN